jgi:hypothetical protein
VAFPSVLAVAFRVTLAFPVYLVIQVSPDLLVAISAAFSFFPVVVFPGIVAVFFLPVNLPIPAYPIVLVIFVLSVMRKMKVRPLVKQSEQLELNPSLAKQSEHLVGPEGLQLLIHHSPPCARRGCTHHQSQNRHQNPLPSFSPPTI